jgi:hypothetical protein
MVGVVADDGEAVADDGEVADGAYPDDGPTSVRPRAPP